MYSIGPQSYHLADAEHPSLPVAAPAPYLPRNVVEREMANANASLSGQIGGAEADRHREAVVYIYNESPDKVWVCACDIALRACSTTTVSLPVQQSNINITMSAVCNSSFVGMCSE